MNWLRQSKKDIEAKRKAVKDALRGKLPRKIKPLGMWFIHGDEVKCPDGSIITKAEFDARQKDEDQKNDDLQPISGMVIGDLNPITDIVVNVIKPKDFEKNLIFESASGCLHELYEQGNATYLGGKPEPTPLQTIGKRIRKAVNDFLSDSTTTKQTAKEPPVIASHEPDLSLNGYNENLLRSPISRPGDQYQFSIGDTTGQLRHRLMEELNRRL